MRAIKFRGLRVDGKGWAFGCYLVSGKNHHLPNMHFIYEDSGSFQSYAGLDGHSVLPETVGQFTGLLDKNGVEIYEGDMFSTRNGYSYFIVFENGSFECYHVKYKDVVNGGMLRWGLLSRAYELSGDFTPKIIGNIHDNPEILKP